MRDPSGGIPYIKCRWGWWSMRKGRDGR